MRSSYFNMSRRTCQGQSIDGLPFFLSPRQKAVLALAAGGCTNRDIALRLGLKVRTVRHYLAEARRRLGASNTTHAVAIAVARGLIDLKSIGLCTQN